MSVVENSHAFGVAVNAAICVKSTYDQFLWALRICVSERLRAAGADGLEQEHPALLAHAVADAALDAVYGIGRDEMSSVEAHVAEAADAAVRFLLVQSGKA